MTVSQQSKDLETSERSHNHKRLSPPERQGDLSAALTLLSSQPARPTAGQAHQPPADPAPGTHQPGPAIQTGDQRHPAARCRRRSPSACLQTPRSSRRAGLSRSSCDNRSLACVVSQMSGRAQDAASARWLNQRAVQQPALRRGLARPSGRGPATGGRVSCRKPGEFGQPASSGSRPVHRPEGTRLPGRQPVHRQVRHGRPKRDAESSAAGTERNRSHTNRSSRVNTSNQHAGRQDRYCGPSLPGRRARRGNRRPSAAHRGDALALPGTRRRPVAGRAAGDDPGARPLLGDRLRLAQVRSEAERAPAVHHRDRRRRHPLHPREVAARERDAADHHARLARLGHRAARGRRPAHRPDRARRPR